MTSPNLLHPSTEINKCCTKKSKHCWLIKKAHFTTNIVSDKFFTIPDTYPE